MKKLCKKLNAEPETIEGYLTDSYCECDCYYPCYYGGPSTSSEASTSNRNYDSQ